MNTDSSNIAGIPRADAARLVLRIAQGMLEIGMPAHRTEAAIHIVLRKLDRGGEVFATPTAVTISQGDGHEQRTLMARANPGQVNLEKLSDLADVIEALDADQVTVRAAADRVERILAKPDRYPGWLTAIAFGLYSASIATVFRGNWIELVAAAGVGLLTGLAGALASRREALGRVFEPAGAALAAFTATLLGSQLSAMSPFLVTMAGIIVLVPGLAFTVATRELATGQLVAGSARFAGAMVIFLGLTFGVALGSQIAEALVGAPDTTRLPPVPHWMRFAMLPVAALAFVFLFRAKPTDYGWIFLASILGMEGGVIGHALLGQQLGSFVGGFFVGLGGNLFSRLLGRPAAIVQFPGLILLVPGSIGFSGLATMMQADILSGIQTAFTALMIAVALATGLLMSSLVLPPKREY